MDSASTSASANPSRNHEYDVFLNHRGPDTKKNFASFLYRRLHLHGFQAFLDQKELQQGHNFDSQIKAAIKSASVHVAIFSPRYAESSWCLKELLLMLKTGATIIPVFYNVKPSDLRWNQNGLYAQALHDHELKLRFDSVTVGNWRSALSHVADISGFELEACNGDGGELLEKVVERVLKKVKRAGLDVAKYPTGLDDKVKEFENTVLLQQQQIGKPQIVGIVGLGGVGKTTLAKELFNRKSSQYDSSCFLFDVRAAKGFLNSLHSKLLNSLTGLDKKIDSIDEGIVLLRKHLSYKQALVVLDDVDDVNQLDAFFPIQSVLRSDSLILITSRDKAVLRSWVKEPSIYKLNCLEPHHSRELFCSHAFTGPHPLPGFESLVEKFIKACDGLPLSLKVLGALLYEIDDQSEWENQLSSLQQILPSDIQGRLKFSYDALDEEEQKIFLDIACFFIGEDRDKASRLWDKSGCKGVIRFRNLHNKCLVELDSKNKIHMHDHLRDMGRAIAKDSKLKLPCRICCSTQNIHDLLAQSHNVQAPVRGIMQVPTTRRPDYRDTMSFVRFFMHHDIYLKRKADALRGNWFMKSRGFLGVDLLDVEGDEMGRILKKVQCPNVTWLRWYKCPYSSLPSWIPLKNLRFLEVAGSALETLWQGQSQAPLQLRELHIYAALSKIPESIGQLKLLERIVITSDGVFLKTLPKEFCQLRSLKYLVLIDLLESLPDCFGDLINLEHLDLSKSTKLKMLPNSFGNLIRLKHLCLSACRNLTMSAQTLGNIRTLEHLDLSYCERLEVLPQQVAHQKSLIHLDLSSCKRLEVLPQQVAYQKSLIRLHLWHTNIKELPSVMGELSDLEVLEIGNNEVQYSLSPWLGQLKNLTKLVAWNCALSEAAFKKVEGQRETSANSSFQEFLPRLQLFSIGKTEMPEISFGEGVCANLHVLSISGCHKLKKVEGLCGLAKLKDIKIYSCSELEELPSVEHCRSLKTLEIRGGSKLQLKEEVQMRERGISIQKYER